MHGAIDAGDLVLHAGRGTNVALLSSHIPVFTCPSTPGAERRLRTLGIPALLTVENPNRTVDRARGALTGRRDYIANYLVQQQGSTVEYFPGMFFVTSHVTTGPAPFHAPEYVRKRPGRLVDVEDGLSKTAMLTEQAGLPTIYEALPAGAAQGPWPSRKDGALLGRRTLYSHGPRSLVV